MSVIAVEARYTPEEYLERERTAGFKSEYVNGRIYAMAGASRRHNLIAGNVFGELRARLKGQPCEAYISDMRVKVAETGRYTYPDVVAACVEIQFEDSHGDTLLNPTVIFEVLSDSTESDDRGNKFAHYRRLPSLQEYVLISQDRIRVEHFLRQGDQWVLTEFSHPESLLPLMALNCYLALGDIYDRVTFSVESE